MYHYSPLFMHAPLFASGIGFLAILLVVWTLAWKGWALWLAARRGESVWFIILLIVNTLGILEIIYIFAVAKQQDTKQVHHHDAAAHTHNEHDHVHHAGEAHSAEHPHHHDHEAK